MHDIGIEIRLSKNMKKLLKQNSNVTISAILSVVIGIVLLTVSVAICGYAEIPVVYIITVELFLGLLVVLGWYVPKWMTSDVDERRGITAKQKELNKWGYYSRDKDGPWIYSISKPVVLKAPELESEVFLSEWLIIKDGNIVINPGKSTIDDNNVKYRYGTTSYAWDGCTPKSNWWFVAILGTPDWIKQEYTIQTLKKNAECVNDVETMDVYWNTTAYASLVHDALYQYLHVIKSSKEQVDKLFYRLLIESNMPKWLAKCYLGFVKCLGGKNVVKQKNSNKRKLDNK
ncbi:hypothetical protein A3715_19585 [Oleiphilus sp. HI0009]|nr:hypothetical protein A3715_19585 [Oleiphilus sp. HI0009]